MFRYLASKNKELAPGVVAHLVIPSLKRPRQEDHQFKVSKQKLLSVKILAFSPARMAHASNPN
jgi:hypothetical protein